MGNTQYINLKKVTINPKQNHSIHFNIFGIIETREIQCNGAYTYLIENHA